MEPAYQAAKYLRLFVGICTYSKRANKRCEKSEIASIVNVCLRIFQQDFIYIPKTDGYNVLYEDLCLKQVLKQKLILSYFLRLNLFLI